jgi:hypothetical protein
VFAYPLAHKDRENTADSKGLADFHPAEEMKLDIRDNLAVCVSRLMRSPCGLCI